MLRRLRMTRVPIASDRSAEAPTTAIERGFISFSRDMRNSTAPGGGPAAVRGHASPDRPSADNISEALVKRRRNLIGRQWNFDSEPGHLQLFHLAGFGELDQRSVYGVNQLLRCLVLARQPAEIGLRSERRHHQLEVVGTRLYQISKVRQ